MATATPVNALSVLALKVKENVFDLGSFLRHISIRDQVIRAQLLVRDLCEGGQLVAGDRVLIVGAGAAGLAAAEALLQRNCEILVVEKAVEPLWLWKGVTARFVGPHMYEWPSSFFDDQTFPAVAPSVLSHWTGKVASTASGLTFTKSQPIAADDLRTAWLLALQSWPHQWPKSVRLITGVNGAQVLAEIQAWRKDVRATNGRPSYPINLSGHDWFGNAPTTVGFPAKLLFLAAGSGAEETALRLAPNGPISIQGVPFWCDDTLLLSRAGVSRKGPVHVAVFGGGDGALQDTLRGLTGCKTPLELLAKLRSHSGLAASLDAHLADLAAIERQHETAATWDVPRPGTSASLAPDVLHRACRAQAAVIASNSTSRTAVLQCERRDVDRVDLVVRENYFGKSYLLNRFLVLLFEECGKFQPSKLKIHWATTAITTKQLPGVPPTYDIGLTSTAVLHDVNVVAVRLGLDRSTIPGQYLGLTKLDTRNRRELAELKLPFSLLT